MGWLYVFLAAVFEMVGVLGLNLFSKRRSFINGLIYYSGIVAALVCLYVSFNYLQVSVAYAVWIGVGTAGAVVMNMVFFGESKSMLRIFSLIAIVAGVSGLKALS